MKIISWNVNGIRSVFRTTFKDWLKSSNPDIVCLQEIKADYKELDKEYTEIDGYYAYFNSSKLKKGHAGVAIYTKLKPISVETVLGIERFDNEGRCLKLTFKDFILFNFYIPHGSRDKHDLPYKIKVYEKLIPKLKDISDKEVILTGDFNIAHKEIDVFHAKQNFNNTMFTQEERNLLENITNLNYTDTFRKKYPDKKEYSWWPYMGNLRGKNIGGWRIDYIYVSKSLENKVKEAFTGREILGSDHGPIGIILDKEIEIEEIPIYEKIEPQASLF